MNHPSSPLLPSHTTLHSLPVDYQVHFLILLERVWSRETCISFPTTYPVTLVLYTFVDSFCTMMRRALMLAAKRQMAGRRIPACWQHRTFPAVQALPVRFLSDLAERPPSAAARTSKDGVVGMPIDFDVNSKVEGNESQVGTTYFVFCNRRIHTFVMFPVSPNTKSCDFLCQCRL
jgi:hypothetical protein